MILLENKPIDLTETYTEPNRLKKTLHLHHSYPLVVEVLIYSSPGNLLLGRGVK